MGLGPLEHGRLPLVEVLVEGVADQARRDVEHHPVVQHPAQLLDEHLALEGELGEVARALDGVDLALERAQPQQRRVACGGQLLGLARGLDRVGVPLVGRPRVERLAVGVGLAARRELQLALEVGDDGLQLGPTQIGGEARLELAGVEHACGGEEARQLRRGAHALVDRTLALGPEGDQLVAHPGDLTLGADRLVDELGDRADDGLQLTDGCVRRRPRDVDDRGVVGAGALGPLDELGDRAWRVLERGRQLALAAPGQLDLLLQRPGLVEVAEPLVDALGPEHLRAAGAGPARPASG